MHYFFFWYQVTKLRSEMEQQRLDLQKTHSTELEKMLEKVSCQSFIQKKIIGLLSCYYYSEHVRSV